jgi:hypothetical protein
MSASVEHTVKVDGVQLPSCRDRRHILVQAGNERDVAWSGFGRDTGMRHAECAAFEDFGAKVGRKRARCAYVSSESCGIRIGIWK